MPDPEFDRDELRRAAPEYTEQPKQSVLRGHLTASVITVLILLLFCLLPFLFSHSSPKTTSPPTVYNSSNRWESSYSVIRDSDNHHPRWELTLYQFVCLLNDRLDTKDLQIPSDSLEDNFSYGRSTAQLNDVNEVLRFFVSVYPQKSDSKWAETDLRSRGNLGRLRLCLWANEPYEVEEEYIRYIVSILTPGAEDFVIEHLGLSDTGEQEYRVKISDVFYVREKDMLTITPFPPD